jgi:hypothetical protein
VKLAIGFRTFLIETNFEAVGVGPWSVYQQYVMIHSPGNTGYYRYSALCSSIFAKFPTNLQTNSKQQLKSIPKGR